MANDFESVIIIEIPKTINIKMFLIDQFSFPNIEIKNTDKILANMTGSFEKPANL